MQEMQETWTQSLGQKDRLEEGMAPQSSILVWKNEWGEKPGKLRPVGLQRVGHDQITFTFTGIQGLYFRSKLDPDDLSHTDDHPANPKKGSLVQEVR